MFNIDPNLHDVEQFADRKNEPNTFNHLLRNLEILLQKTIAINTSPASTLVFYFETESGFSHK